MGGACSLPPVNHSDIKSIKGTYIEEGGQDVPPSALLCSVMVVETTLGKICEKSKQVMVETLLQKQSEIHDYTSA